MIKGIYTAARSLHEKMKSIEVIANNLANINTTGFKREVPFAEVLNKEGKAIVKQFTDFKQGEITDTANPLDFAISGKGFFTIQTQNGIEYTRNGNFTVSDEGFIVTQNGDKVLGNHGPIAIGDYLLDKNDSINVSKNGEIKVGNMVVDSLQIVIPDQLSQTYNTGNSGFVGGGEFNVASPDQFQVLQGSIEGSNVNPITEMQDMIQINSSYESATKIMNSLDRSLEQANEIGKV